MAYRAASDASRTLREPSTTAATNHHYTLKTTLASITKYRLYTEPPSFEERHYLLKARSPRAKRDRDASPYGTPARKTINNGERVKSVRVTYEEHTRVGP
jgi:hypothetical protein